MFEKEADYITDYKKARKESKDKITKVISVWSAREETLHEEGFKDGAEFGYNKANEWHYVKDELPIITEKGRWLNLILKDRRVESFWWNFKSVPQRVIDNFRADVIAWKEIVLPNI